jgi:SAM-dependent methyltransferase
MNMAQVDATGSTKELQAHPAEMLLCWHCGGTLAEMTADTRMSSGMRVCAKCMNKTHLKDGIWCALPPHRFEHFRKFISEYQLIRAAEGRGSTQAEYYLGLPYEDLSGRNSDQWNIRAHTFQTIEKRILTPLAKFNGRPLRILDLGAGNGWMSYRLAIRGHFPIAVDLLTNSFDGLGAAIHYSTQIHPLFPRVQAELDWIPFASSSFDVAIFNASFHYSEDYQRTFAEALRCIRPGGSVVIADTPWYEKEDSGKRMVAEKHDRFASIYGFPSDSVPSLEYFTPDRLHRLQNAFGLKWSCIRPFYGFRWALRPVRAKLKRRRPPSQFHIYVAQVSA